MLCLLEIAVVVVFGKRLLIIITIEPYNKDVNSILLGTASLIKAAGNLVERVSFVYAFRYRVYLLITCSNLRITLIVLLSRQNRTTNPRINNYMLKLLKTTTYFRLRIRKIGLVLLNQSYNGPKTGHVNIS